MLQLSQKFCKNLTLTLLSSQKQVVPVNARQISLTTNTFCQAKSEEAEVEEELPVIDEKKKHLDRTKVIPVEKGIKYLKSAAYKETYGDYLVWEQYRRNHKGVFPPKKTRKTCVRKGAISTGNPCPICRDEYLVLHPQNIDLLKQFISPQTGQVLSYSKTGVCQKKHLELLVAVEQAMDAGLLTFEVPFREYDYSEYFDNLEKVKTSN